MWEFQAVLKGRIARTQAAQLGGDIPEANYRNRSLWLSRPGSAHGWHGRADVEASVAVFHFRQVPKALDRSLGLREQHVIALGKAEAFRIEYLARRVAAHWNKPSPGMLLVAEAVLSELSLLVYEDLEDAPGTSQTLGVQTVRRALEVYSATMAGNPSVSGISEEVGVSVAHLRRLFQAHMGASPKKIFDQLREQRILKLLSDPELSLEAIAEQTGFSEASALSRAFNTRFGCPPSRMRIFSPY